MVGFFLISGAFPDCYTPTQRMAFYAAEIQSVWHKRKGPPPGSGEGQIRREMRAETAASWRASACAP